MAQARLSVRKIREVLRLKSEARLNPTPDFEAIQRELATGTCCCLARICIPEPQ